MNVKRSKKRQEKKQLKHLSKKPSDSPASSSLRFSLLIAKTSNVAFALFPEFFIVPTGAIELTIAEQETKGEKKAALLLTEISCDAGDHCNRRYDLCALIIELAPAYIKLNVISWWYIKCFRQSLMTSASSLSFSAFDGVNSHFLRHRRWRKRDDTRYKILNKIKIKITEKQN